MTSNSNKDPYSFDLAELGSTIATLVFTILLIVALAWLYKRFHVRLNQKGSSKQMRMNIEEILPLDPKRRLIRVRDGAGYHLLLLSPMGDKVVYSHISTNVPPTNSPLSASQPDEPLNTSQSQIKVQDQKSKKSKKSQFEKKIDRHKLKGEDVEDKKLD